MSLTKATYSMINGAPVNVKDFGAKGDGVTDDTVALQAARDYIASFEVDPYTKNPAPIPALVFPGGTYVYSLSPDWGINGAEIIADGTVILQYTGTEDAVVINNNPATSGSEIYKFRVKMMGFSVNCPSTAKNGVRVTRCGHSEFEFYVFGAGSVYAGIYIDFCVTSIFINCTVTKERSGNNWYNNAQPKHGFYLTSNYPGGTEATSYCTFINAIAEFCQNGITIDIGLGNVFIGGTAEANTNAGYFGGAPSFLNSNNRFYGMDFENNAVYDILDQANATEFHGCDSAGLVRIVAGGQYRRFIGGNYQNILIDSGADITSLIGITYNKFKTTGTITNNSTNTQFIGVVNAVGSTYQLPSGSATLSGTSYSYTNTYGNPVQILFGAGTNVSVRISRNGVFGAYLNANLNYNSITLDPSDVIQLAYTSPPTFQFYVM